MAFRGQPLSAVHGLWTMVLAVVMITGCGPETNFVEQTGQAPLPRDAERSNEQLDQDALDAIAASGNRANSFADQEFASDETDPEGEFADDFDPGDEENIDGPGGDTSTDDTSGTGDTTGGTMGDDTGGSGGATGGATSDTTGGDTTMGDDTGGTGGTTGGDTTGGDTTGGDTTMGDDTGGTGGTTGGDTTGGDTSMGGDSSGDDSGSATAGNEAPLPWEDRETTVVQSAPGNVDILWIVDSSGSMAEEQNYLGTNFNSFIHQITSIGINFQTAVTSTDVCTAEIPEDLAERACPVNYGGSEATRHRGNFIGENGAQILIQGQSDLAAKFLEYTAVGINGSGFEHGLRAAHLAIEKSLNGGNPAFLREDSFLAIIVVSDEEDDGIGLGMIDAYNGINFVSQGLTTFSYTDQNLIAYLTGVKGAGKFSVSAITGTRDQNGNMCSSNHSQPLEEGTQYIKAANETGGIVQSICESNWSSSLAQIGYDINAQITQIALDGSPDAASIQVTVDGQANTAWTYISGTKSVKFNADAVPAVGAIIRVTYRTLP